MMELEKHCRDLEGRLGKYEVLVPGNESSMFNLYVPWPGNENCWSVASGLGTRAVVLLSFPDQRLASRLAMRAVYLSLCSG